MTTHTGLVERPPSATEDSASPDGAFPLLPLQQGMLFHLFADPTSGIDLNQIVASTPERLDVELFTRAWQRVLDRHPALRTTFRWEAGEEPSQRVIADATVVVASEDWRDVPPIERDDRLAQFLVADRRRETLLTRCPVWRVTVFDHGADGYRFVYTCPHAVMDGQSLYLVFEEFFTFYEAFSLGREADLPIPPPISEFMTWVRGLDHAAAEAYWRDKLENFPGLPTLLIPRGDSGATGRGQQRIQLSAELASALRSLAKAHRVTMSLVMRAAWATLLGRLCGSLDVTFGEVRWGRRSTVKDAGSMIGLFVNTIPVRVAIDRNTTVADLLQVLREDQGAVRDYEHAGLHDIQQWAGVQPGSALLETLFIFDQASFETPLRKKGGSWGPRRFSNHERTSLPLTVNIHAEPELEIQISYDQSRFADAFMARTVGYFGVILEQFAANPAQRVSVLDILPADERRRLFETWNGTDRAVPADLTVPQLFEEQVKRTPDRVALQHGNGRLTYRELEARVNRLARYLRKAGVGPDVLVGVCLDRSEDLIVALLATMKAGGAYVPIDPGFPADRIRLMVEDAAPGVVLTSTRYQPQFVDGPTRVLCLDGAARFEFEREPSAALEPLAGPADLAYVIYTSGSTGRPKGVMLAHANVTNCFVGMDDVLGRPQDGIWLAVTSISFDISVLELFYTLTRGFTIVLGGEPTGAPGGLNADGTPQAGGAGPGDVMGPSLGDLISRHRVTHLQCTPSLAKMMLADPGTHKALGLLRILMLGGEALPEELLRRLSAVKGLVILNMYGPTETTIWSTSARVDGTPPPVSIGRPIANTRLYVVDQQLAATPIGVPGELLIAGNGVARGYLRRPELTAERFVPHPFDAAGGPVYRTGDLVRYRDDGRLDYLGRLDHQVKLHGHRIELGEIEAAMLQFPGVEDAAVIVRHDAGDEPQLVAYYVPRQGATPDPGALRTLLSERLPSYMMPYDFVALEAFPLTPNGKLDRNALPRAESNRAASTAEFVAASTEVEAGLVETWTQLLGVDRVSIRDNFFDLGGNSLMVVHLSRRVRERFAVEMPLTAFFQHPTIEKMAQLIAAQGGAGDENRWATVESHRENPFRSPLVAIHGVENIFARLPRLLPADQPFLIITSRAGFDGQVPPYFPCRSIEDMADQYLRELRQVQPRGPYSLIGFCMGGLIAFEVARRLVDRGEEVAFLGVVNALPTKVPDTTGTINRHLSELSQRDVFDQVGYVARRGVRTLADWQRRLRKVGETAAYRLIVRAGFPVDAESVAKRIGKFGLEMIQRYRPAPYKGKVWLFHGSHGPADTRERWAALALGGLEAHAFATDHFGLMAEPHVGDLAMRLTACMKAAEEDAAGDRIERQLELALVG